MIYLKHGASFISDDLVCLGATDLQCQFSKIHSPEKKEKKYKNIKILNPLTDYIFYVIFIKIAQFVFATDLQRF